MAAPPGHFVSSQSPSHRPAAKGRPAIQVCIIHIHPIPSVSCRTFSTVSALSENVIQWSGVLPAGSIVLLRNRRLKETPSIPQSNGYFHSIARHQVPHLDLHYHSQKSHITSTIQAGLFRSGRNMDDNCSCSIRSKAGRHKMGVAISSARIEFLAMYSDDRACNKSGYGSGPICLTFARVVMNNPKEWRSIWALYRSIQPRLMADDCHCVIHSRSMEKTWKSHSKELSSSEHWLTPSMIFERWDVIPQTRRKWFRRSCLFHPHSRLSCSSLVSADMLEILLTGTENKYWWNRTRCFDEGNKLVNHPFCVFWYFTWS